MTRTRELYMDIEVMDRTFCFDDQVLNLVSEEEPEVTSAYFAEKTVKEESLKDGTYQYTFEKVTSTDSKTKRSNVAKAIHKSINDELSSQNKEVKLVDITKIINEKETGKKWPLQSHAKDSTLTFDQYKKETKIYYKKITSAPMGYQVYLITETRNLKDKTVKLKIYEKESDLKLLKTKDDILPVLVFAKKEDTTTDTEASDWIAIDVKEENGTKENGNLFLYKEENENKIEVGIKKIQLRPKEDKIKTDGEDAFKSFEGWQEALYIREDETEEGKKAIEDAKVLAETRKNETFITLTRDADADKKENKKSFPKEISGPKTISIDKDAVYTLDTYGTSATEDDKKNIRWSFYVQGDPKTTTADKEKTYIDAKSKTGWYTYAKSEIIDSKNQLTLVFDKALVGKKIQIEAFRGSPDLSNKKDYVKTTTVQETPEPKISKREITSLWLTTQCESVENTGEMIGKDFKSYFKLKTPGLLFPFRTIPLNHPDGFKNNFYTPFNYTLREYKAPTFGVLRSSTRIHAARDLYYELNEPIYSIADGVVKRVASFYWDTWVIEIEHEYQKKSGFNIMVRYGEVNKNNILVKTGDKVVRGQKIAEIGLLTKNGRFIKQPSGEKRGMLHLEIYTGEESGALSNTSVKYNEMLYAKSGKHISGSSFQRRKDLIDPLSLLNIMYKNSKKEGLMK
ncbi:M23 family metallopeptidase [Aquimarina sp. M1]